MSIMTLMASWVTGNTTMSAPEMSYELGVWGFIGYSGAAFGLFFFAPIAKRIKQILPQGLTSGDFMRLRFGKPAWIVFILVSTSYLIVFLVTQGMAGGILLEALSGINYTFGMSQVFVVCILYTLMGGMRAVIGTDFIQAMIILITLLIVAIAAFINVPPTTIYDQVVANSPSHMNLLLPAGLLFAWNTTLWCFGEIFHGNIWWQRIYAQREEVTVRSFYISGAIWFFVPIVTGLLALYAIAQNLLVPQVNMVFPIVASTLLGKGGAVLVLIIVFSSLTSTADSLMASTSDFLAQDVYRQMINPKANDRQVLVVSKALIVILGVISLLIALGKFNSIYKFFMLTGPLVGSTVWPIILGVYWKEASAKGALWAMLIGTLAGELSYFFYATYSSAVVGTVVSGIVMVLFTTIRPDKFDWNVFKEFNLAVLAEEE